MGRESIVTPELQKKYIERRKAELTQMEDAIANKDFDSLSVFGHNMKGNAESYGFEDLGLMGAKLEQAAKSEELDKIKSLYQNIKSFILEQKV